MGDRDYRVVKIDQEFLQPCNGKSTFLKILSGALETTNGDVSITPGQRLSVLEQDHFKYDAYPVMDTVYRQKSGVLQGSERCRRSEPELTAVEPARYDHRMQSAVRRT